MPDLREFYGWAALLAMAVMCVRGWWLLESMAHNLRMLRRDVENERVIETTQEYSYEENQC